MVEILRVLGTISILFGIMFTVILVIATPPLLQDEDSAKCWVKLVFLTLALLAGGWFLGGTLKF